MFSEASYSNFMVSIIIIILPEYVKESMEQKRENPNLCHQCFQCFPALTEKDTFYFQSVLCFTIMSTKKCKYELILYRGQYKGQATCEKVSSPK